MKYSIAHGGQEIKARQVAEPQAPDAKRIYATLKPKRKHGTHAKNGTMTTPNDWERIRYHARPSINHAK